MLTVLRATRVSGSLVVTGGTRLAPGRTVSTAQWQRVASAHGQPAPPNIRTLERHAKVLGVSVDASDSELRAAFTAAARRHHPDTGEDSDGETFVAVTDAYRALQAANHDAHAAEQVGTVRAEPDHDSPVHTPLVHRRYINLDGVGPGTSAERARRAKMVRIDGVTESLRQSRIDARAETNSSTGSPTLRSGATAMESIPEKDSRSARRSRSRPTMDIERKALEAIDEAYRQGQFDNLPGAGKPLKELDESPLLDRTAARFNQIVKDQGFAPQWVLRGKELRGMLAAERTRLDQAWRKVAPLYEADLAANSPSAEERLARTEWAKAKTNWLDASQKINKEIIFYNLLCPTTAQHMYCVNADAEIEALVSQKSTESA